MNKKIKISFLISTLLIINIVGFSYATEEDGRFVDIPVPPASSGRTDFSSEQAEEQTKEYEEKQNSLQSNSVTIGQDYILYPETKNENIENIENIESIKDDSNGELNISTSNNVIENITEDTDENVTNEVMDETTENTYNDEVETKNDNKEIILVGIAIVFAVIVVIATIKIQKGKKRNGKRRK